MPSYTRDDLKLDYVWSSLSDIDPYEELSSNQRLLDRRDGYDVLDFLRELEAHYELQVPRPRLERAIREAPLDVRTRGEMIEHLLAT